MYEGTANEMAVEVTEIEFDRGYWLARPWISPATVTVAGLQDADVLVVPWESFRPNRDALFPEGTGDFVRQLRRSLAIEVAIDRDKYEEIALYADAWRIPTLFCKYAAIPLLISLLSAEVDRRFISDQEATPVSVEVIVEGPAGRCVSIKYEGPANELPDELLKQAGSCFPTVDRPSQLTPAKSNVSPTAKGKNGGLTGAKP